MAPLTKETLLAVVLEHVPTDRFSTLLIIDYRRCLLWSRAKIPLVFLSAITLGCGGRLSFSSHRGQGHPRGYALCFI